MKVTESMCLKKRGLKLKLEGTRANKILESRHPDYVGMYNIDIPTNVPIKTEDLTIDNIVEGGDESFKILAVELIHILCDPPIPKLMLRCRKC